MISTALKSYLSDLPGRCVSCGFHVPTQEHRATCPDRSEWSVLVAALKRSAKDDGRIHQADVRPLIRGRIEPKHIGQLYKRAIREGVIREIDREQSDDEIGGNTNKWEPVYRLRSAA